MDSMEGRISKERLAGALLLVLVGAAMVSVAAGTALWARGIPPRISPPPLTTGVAAPQFELESLTGETVSLEQFKGRPVIVMFWGSG